MKKTILPLLMMAVAFCCCSESPTEAPKAAQNKAAKYTDHDVSHIAKDYKISLQSLIVDMLDNTDIKTLLCQQWEHGDDGKDARDYGNSGSINMSVRGFVFFNNGTVVRNPRGYLSFGKWEYKDANKTIAIRLDDGDTYLYKIKAIAADELKLIDMDEDDPNVETYVAQAFCYRKNSDDPFFAANNQWRIKPRKPETEAQIAKRAKDCIHFYRLFFDDNLLRDSSIISFMGLPNCFSWYDGGIGVKRADQLDDDWIDCFYNKDQALKAHARLEKWITEPYDWTPGYYDWRVKTVKVLRQMDERLSKQ